MLFSNKTIPTFIAILSLFVTVAAEASSGRYQAHWNGKSYLVLDTDQGHMWTYHGDSMLYNGRIDGDEFEPPESPQIWQQSHGKWSKRK